MIFGGNFNENFTEISSQILFKMPQYKIIDEETGNMYLTRVKKTIFVLQKVKYFLNTLLSMVSNMQEARKVKNATCRKIMRQFIYYTEVFVLLHWLETCAVLEIFNFLQ